MLVSRKRSYSLTRETPSPRNELMLNIRGYRNNVWAIPRLRVNASFSRITAFPRVFAGFEIERCVHDYLLLLLVGSKTPKFYFQGVHAGK